MKTKLRSASGQTVYDTLRAEILNLKLPPGQELDEVQLATRFNVSRTPIREVIVRLAAENLVELRHNRGARVSLMNFDELPAMIESLEILERLTIRRAARSRTDEDLAEMRAISARFEECVAANDHEGIVELNWRFHDVINRASGNRFLAEDATRALTRMLRLSIIIFRGAAVGREVAEQHQEMVAAIAAGDIAEADRLTMSHNEVLRKALTAYLNRSGLAKIDLDPLVH